MKRRDYFIDPSSSFSTHSKILSSWRLCYPEGERMKILISCVTQQVELYGVYNAGLVTKASPGHQGLPWSVETPLASGASLVTTSAVSQHQKASHPPSSWWIRESASLAFTAFHFQPHAAMVVTLPRLILRDSPPPLNLCNPVGGRAQSPQCFHRNTTAS